MPVFVVEHLEPRVYKWCLLEYAHMSKWVGEKNLWFTNTRSERLRKFGRVIPRSVAKLGLENACVLDPEAPQTLTPALAKQFDFFVFGGILGDNPPKARTKEALSAKLPFPVFNLGKEQMSTDTAVIVAKMICDGKKLSQLNFQDGVEVEVGPYSSVELPYRYLVVDNKPLLAPGIRELLRKQGTI